ncbi:phage terminase large subunit family protein [Methylomagnum ishizawai]|uniref:phage terminase large subunit family protein n=1 Tax=Methylomagnum ishizawai TaxID=1760988 RepID=UPI001C33875E|nr:terminase gpA endonuclease subunit [Methylomagnum ishizawai]BBL75598.1 terminase [Methylomagnum ishizawai]
MANKRYDPRARAAARLLAAVDAGLEPLRVDPPMRMSEWSRAHFYLSRESSHGEGGWEPWPYQIAVMDCIGDDDIREVDVKKSTRWGYTKIMLCGLLYFAEHKKRNQAVWQPTDADKIEFVKTELDPALRDVKRIQKIFPNSLRKSANNTQDMKRLLTGVIYNKGGTSAKEYRRITIGAGWFDELAAFPSDVEGEGRAFNLGLKRIEGSPYGKMVAGSTPRIKTSGPGSCQIDERVNMAQEVFVYHIPCPECGREHALEFGATVAEKHARGFHWDDDDPATVRYACPQGGCLYTQAQYLAIADHPDYLKRGRWLNPATGTWIDINPGGELLFRDAAGAVVPKAAHIAFHGWSAYSPQKSWASIAAEFIAARLKAAAGDSTLLKTFWNTTAGECWEEEVEQGDAAALIARAEPYPLRTVPRDALVLVGFTDVQGDRFELVVWGIGPGEEMWVVDYRVIDNINPFIDGDWNALETALGRRYKHARGGTLGIEICGVDTGYATHQAYRFCRGRERRRIYATKGETKEGQPIKSRMTRPDVKQHTGKPIPNGCKLYWIGTDAAKDTIYGRLQVADPGPGYVHFSKDLPPQFYEQLTSEQRVKTKSGGDKWEKPNSHTRNEVLDCTVGALWGFEMLVEGYRSIDRFWQEYERRLAQPDLMEWADEPPTEPAAPGPAPSVPVSIPAPVPAKPARPVAPRIDHGFGSADWSL